MTTDGKKRMTEIEKRLESVEKSLQAAHGAISSLFEHLRFLDDKVKQLYLDKPKKKNGAKRG